MAGITVCCVNQGNYLGRGAEYVAKLHDMIRRNLPAGMEGKFVCFTDDPQGISPLSAGIEVRRLPPDLEGWWSKLFLFSQEAGFTADEQVFYFDLDTVITGPLDRIFTYRGDFAILRDFYRKDGLGSGVMSWHGDHSHAWRTWNEIGRPVLDGGDQQWLEWCGIKADRWQDLFPDQFVSYKAQNCYQMFPKGAKVVCFHGKPRPHEAQGWVEKVWKIGGGTSLEMELRCNTSDQQLLENVQTNLAKQKSYLPDGSANHDCAIVCGGPSIKDSLNMIRAVSSNSYMIAANNAASWLLNHGVTPNAQIVMDARQSNKDFLGHGLPIDYYLASQVDPSLFTVADGTVHMFHIANPYLIELLQKRKEPACCIGGGRTVGLIAIGLAIARGHRRIHLFGYDSSYGESNHHAYEQPLNDGDDVITVEYQGRMFTTTPWMVQQVEDFQQLAAHFVPQGIEFIVHGDGLLPWVSECMSTIAEAA